MCHIVSIFASNVNRHISEGFSESVIWIIGNASMLTDSFFQICFYIIGYGSANQPGTRIMAFSMVLGC